MPRYGTGLADIWWRMRSWTPGARDGHNKCDNSVKQVCIYVQWLWSYIAYNMSGLYILYFKGVVLVAVVWGFSSAHLSVFPSLLLGWSACDPRTVDRRMHGDVLWWYAMVMLFFDFDLHFLISSFLISSFLISLFLVLSPPAFLWGLKVIREFIARARRSEGLGLRPVHISTYVCL